MFYIIPSLLLESSIYIGIWIIKKGIAPRTGGGQFRSRESIKFAIAKTIYKRGIKPSLFFTKPFQKYFKDVPQEITDAFGLDVANFMSFIIKQNFKTK